MIPDPLEYKPGSCNLGQEEVRRRYRIGFIGLAGFALLALGIWYFNLPRSFRFLAFAPIFYSLSGFIQARQRFCYIYGFKGLRSLSGLRQFSRTHDPVQLRLERQKAIRIVLFVALLSLLTTLLYYVFR